MVRHFAVWSTTFAIAAHTYIQACAFEVLDADTSFPEASACSSSADQQCRVLLQRKHARLAENVLAGPHVCILARTCGPSSKCAPGENVNKSVSLTHAFLASIRAQVYESWELHLINSEGGGEVFNGLLSSFKDVRFTNGPSSPNRFVRNTFGYDATNYALEQLLQGHGVQAPCSYFLFTNADNLYSQDFLKIGLESMQASYDLIGFNFVTKYEQTADSGQQIVGHRPMQHAGFVLGHIDLGAALVSAQAIQEAKARFPTEPGKVTVTDQWVGDVEHEKLNISDWLFFSSILKRPGSKGQKMMEELPFIHQ